jgi:hypothetical protein
MVRIASAFTITISAFSQNGKGACQFASGMFILCLRIPSHQFLAINDVAPWECVWVKGPC